MAVDALDPGPAGDYPNIPRNPDGTLDTTRMPITPYQQPQPGNRRGTVPNHALVDPTKTLPDGRPVTDVVPLRPTE